MADDLSLLFRLKADNTQAKAVLTDTRAAVAQLRQSFGPQLTQSVSVANKAFSDLGNNINQFVAQRVPLVGGAIVRITDGLRGFGAEGAKTEKAIAGVANSIQTIATQSGKSLPAITTFLSRFIQIEGAAKRDAAAVEFFGAAMATKLVPELAAARVGLAALSAESAAAGSGVAAMAGPIGIAVLAVAALTAGIVIAAREIFQLSKSAADFQGKMFDLAQQTGLAVETLSAFEVVSRTTGGNLGTITQAIVQFQRKLDEAQDPLSKTAEQFRKFNIDTTDTESALRQTFLALAAMPEGFAQTNAAAEFFGARGGKQFLAILKETNGNIDETIKRLRELGIHITEDAARAADKFNDDLVILELQLRALTAVATKDLIPVVAEMIRAFGDLVTAIRPLITIFGSIAGTALRPVALAFKGLSLVVQALTGDYKGLAKAIKEAREQQEIAPINVPGVSPIPLPGAPTQQQTSSEAVNQADAIVAAVKRSVAAQNQVLDELFQKGRRTREQQANETIASNQRVLDADKQRIDALLSQKEGELKALDEAQRNRGEIVNRDTDAFRSVTAEIVKLQQERLDKEALFEVTAREIKAKAAKERADAIRNQIRNESDLTVGEFDRQIKEIEARIKRGAVIEEDGLTIIEQIEQAKLEVRRQSLERQREVGFLTIQDQVDLNNELQKLDQESDRLKDEQAARRIQRERATGQRAIDIAVANIDTLLQLELIAGERRIDTLQALADRRVITEEEAARQILQIRLDLIDDEIEATKSKLAATTAVADADERIRAQAELNNQIKILMEQRKSIQASGTRDIEAGQRADIENERRYADDLREVKERVRDIERDVAEETIRLMIIHFASRRDIIRARLQEDIKDEDARHRQAEETLKELERENRESNKTQEEKLEFETEINRLREAELRRHTLEEKAIKDEARKEEALAGPGGGFAFGLSTGQLSELQNGVQEFADVARVAFSAVGAVVNQLASGIGNLVQNFVLLGSNGPNAFRKLVASVLAGVAAQAATLAIMELAYGIAALTPWGAAIYGPAPFHFKSAALFGSIAAVAGVAGRGVAGGLFQQGAGGGAGGGSDQRGELNPLALQRNAGGLAPSQIAPQIQPQRVEVRVTVAEGRFADAIKTTVVDDINNAGPIREVLAGDGNLNRG